MQSTDPTSSFRPASPAFPPRAGVATAVALALGLLGAEARAATNTWNTTASGQSWDTASHWSLGTKPTASDQVVFPDLGQGASGPTISLTDGEQAYSLSFTGGYSFVFPSLTLTSGGVDVANGLDIGMFSNLNGTAGLTKTGAGTLQLSQSNGYTGGTTVSAGTLRFTANGSVLGNILDNATVEFLRFGDHTFAGNISGSGVLLKTGSATQTFTGDLSHTGGTTVSAGFVQIGAGGTSGSIAGNVSLNSGTRITFNRSDSLTYGGALSGAGGLQKQGAGTLTLTGTNTNTGNTTVTGGTLQLGNGGTSGSLDSNVSVASGAQLAFDRSDAVSFGKTISGTGGSVVQNGTGTTTLTAANSYTGGTTVNAGTLAAGNATAFGSGAVTVNAGATVKADSGVTINNAIALNGGSVGGSGTFNTNLDFSNGATLKPGDSPGTLNGTTATWGQNGIYEFEVRNFGGTAGTDWDLLNLTGTLTVAATAANPFLIKLISLTLGNLAGPAAGFDPTQIFSLKLANAASVTGFSAGLFNIDTSGFQNATNGGTWSVASTAVGVFLDFTPNSSGSSVPELDATSGGGALVFLAGLLALVRERRPRG